MVKCADCGFLSLRHVETRELREAEGDYCETGIIPRQTTQPQNAYEEKPLCFQRIITFDAEQCATPQGRVAAIQEERGQCPEFTPWQQGFTPKEHREMLDREWLLDWQAKQRRDDRMWRLWEIGALVVGGGAFTALGVVLAGIL